MQRIERLIEKLKEQYTVKASPEQMLATLQLLEAELTQRMKETSLLGASHVTVLVPHAPSHVQAGLLQKINKEIDDEEKEMYSLPPLSEAELEEEEDSPFLYNPLLHGRNTDDKGVTEMGIEEVPTFFQQETKEGEAVSRPLFNKIHKINDLNKAIDEESRAIFVKELFRNDEAMFARSIKTINNFHILAEAEYWIKRELKTKLGWPTDTPVVEYFDELVKQRFR
ncbi:MAG: hypothetical protein QM727_15395 [Niabella sp.]